MAENSIRTHPRLSLITIFVTWLTVFLFPAITFRFSLDWLFDLTYQAGCRAIQPELINEMARFNRQARTVPALENILKKFCSKNQSLILKNDPDLIHETLKKNFSLDATVCIAHGADSDELKFFVAREFSSQLGILPRRLTQKAIFSFNRQHEHSFFSRMFEEKAAKIFSRGTTDELNRDARKFFRQQFALIAEMPLVENRVLESISGKCNGPVYFFYHAIRERLNGTPAIKGGVLFMIVGRHINYRKLLEASLVPENPRLVRGYCSNDFSIALTGQNCKNITSTFEERDGSYSLKGLISQEMLVDLIQRGTFFPGKLSQTAEKMPVLKVSINNSLLHHPLLQFNRLINFLLKLLVVMGGLFLLNLYFFGFQLFSGIRKKILTGLFFILLLPGSLVLVVMLTWFDSGRIETRYLARNNLMNQLESIQQQFQNYLTQAQLATLNFARQIERSGLKPDSDLVQRQMQQFLNENDSNLVGFDDLVGGSKFLTENEATGLVKSEEDMLKGTSRAVLNTFTPEGRFDMSYEDGIENKFTNVHPAFVNEILNSWGRLFEYGRFKTGNRVSIVPLLFPGLSTPRAFVITRYPQKDLIEGFVKKLVAERKFPDNLKIFRYEEQDGVNMFFDCKTGKVVDDSFSKGLFENLLKGESQTFSTVDGKMMLLQLMVDFPFICQATGSISETGENKENDFVILFVLAVVLFSFAYLVFGRVYLEPVREFSRVTRQVAAGNLTVRASVFTADEFGVLKNAFDSMIEGIDQKEKMSQFVSSEVLNVIGDDDSDEAIPEGARVEATVAFVRFPELMKMNEPEKIARTLGDIIDLVEEVASAKDGVIDKIIEDTIMLVFRKSSGAGHAFSACQALLMISEGAGKKDWNIEAGIATGSVVMGRIGSRLGKLDFTVIGDTVNLAARLKAEAKKAATSGILIAPSTIRKLRGLARVSFIERVSIKGKSRAFQLYELTGLR